MKELFKIKGLRTVALTVRIPSANHALGERIKDLFLEINDIPNLVDFPVQDYDDAYNQYNGRPYIEVTILLDERNTQLLRVLNYDVGIGGVEWGVSLIEADDGWDGQELFWDGPEENLYFVPVKEFPARWYTHYKTERAYADEVYMD